MIERYKGYKCKPQRGQFGSSIILIVILEEPQATKNTLALNKSKVGFFFLLRLKMFKTDYMQKMNFRGALKFNTFVPD